MEALSAIAWTLGWGVLVLTAIIFVAQVFWWMWAVFMRAIRTTKGYKYIFNAVTTDPIGPLTTDYEQWLDKHPEITGRFDNRPGMGFSLVCGYVIWRAAWLACETERGIRR